MYEDANKSQEDALRAANNLKGVRNMSGLTMRENMICGLTGMLDDITAELENLKRRAADEDYSRQDIIDDIEMLLSKLM